MSQPLLTLVAINYFVCHKNRQQPVAEKQMSARNGQYYLNYLCF